MSDIRRERLGPTRLTILALLMDGTRNGQQPSKRELARHFGFNLNAVAGHLAGLEKKGLIERPYAITVARAVALKCRFIPVDEL